MDQVSTGVKSAHEGGPQDFVLQQNFPNPFNPATQIAFELTKPTTVSLVIYDCSETESKPCFRIGWQPAGIQPCGMAVMKTTVRWRQVVISIS
jgi:hypothetical protein